MKLYEKKLSSSFASAHILFKNISGIEQTFILRTHSELSNPDPNFRCVKVI